MSIKRMLVAVDGSEGSDRALEMAAEIAQPNAETQVDLVYVVPVPPLEGDQELTFKTILDAMVKNGEELLEEAKEKVPAIADHIETKVIVGNSPAAEILDLIDERTYDLVVIGCRGLSGIKAYLGSVSHKVLNGSKVSVLIAK